MVKTDTFCWLCAYDRYSIMHSMDKVLVHVNIKHYFYPDPKLHIQSSVFNTQLHRTESSSFNNNLRNYRLYFGCIGYCDLQQDFTMPEEGKGSKHETRFTRYSSEM